MAIPGTHESGRERESGGAMEGTKEGCHGEEQKGGGSCGGAVVGEE